MTVMSRAKKAFGNIGNLRLLLVVAIVPTVTGDTPAPAGYVHAGAATQNPVQITTDDDDVAVLLALLLT